MKCCTKCNAVQLSPIDPVSRRGGVILFDAEHRRQAVLISEAPSGARDGPIERSTRRGLPKRGVALVTLELAA